MIEPSQRLQTIFENSIKLAKKLGHEYITIEHLVCSIMSDADSYNQIQEFGADANFIRSNLEHYLKNNLNDIKSEDADVKPKKTHSIERVLNRCFSQVLFSGRQRMEIFDIVVSVMSEKNSFAFYFLTKGGITKEKFVNHFQEVLSSNEEQEQPVASPNQIERVINQFCTNLSLLAKQRKIDPVIGRDEEIEKIIDLGENSELFEGLVGGFDNIKRKHVRDSTVGFLDYDNNTSWVFEKMADYAKEANNEMWSFDLLGFGDGIQYTKYFGGGGHYDWHADIGETCSHRKISMVVQLSDETDYDGGILQLNVGHQLLEVPKLKGSLSIFPSYLLHRVTPVVTGVRKSLVSWVSGPNLR